MPTRRLTDSDLENIRRRVEASSAAVNTDSWVNLVQGSSLTYVTNILKDLEPYFEGNRADASRNARLLFNNYKYYNEIMLSALEFFANHLTENRNFFSYDVYIQWLNAMRLGLHSAPDYCVLSRFGLNYPDNAEPSPRIEAVKAYMGYIYALRKWVEDFKLALANGEGGRFASMTPARWNGYLQETRQGLVNSLGSQERAEALFREVFGSDNPNIPQNQAETDDYQRMLFDRLTRELLRPAQAQQTQQEQHDRERGPGSFNRDYVGEQQERQAREREEQARREREQEINQQEGRGENETPPPTSSRGRGDDPNPPPTGGGSEERRDRSPAREEGERQARGEAPERPPATTEFSGDVNELLDKMSGAFEEDSKENAPGGGGSPTGGDMPGVPGVPSSPQAVTLEERKNMPWLVMGFDLADDQRFYQNNKPNWTVKDPTTMAVFRSGHGKGSVVTLYLELDKVKKESDHLYHNFFWETNLGTKGNEVNGYARLVKDTEPARERERIKGFLYVAKDPKINERINMVELVDLEPKVN